MPRYVKCTLFICFFFLYIPHTSIFWCLIEDGAKWCGTSTFELWWTVEGSQGFFLGYVWDPNLRGNWLFIQQLRNMSAICILQKTYPTQNTLLWNHFLSILNTFVTALLECTHLLYSRRCAAHKPLLGLSSSVLFFTPVLPVCKSGFAERYIIPYFCASKSMGLSNTAFFFGFVVLPTGCICRVLVDSAVLIYLCISTGFAKHHSIP